MLAKESCLLILISTTPVEMQVYSVDIFFPSQDVANPIAGFNGDTVKR